MGGGKAKALKKIIEQFNKQSDSVHVNVIHQGSYDDILKKLRVGWKQQSLPAVIMNSSFNQKILVNLDIFKPMYKFIEEHNYDLSGYEDKILRAYEVDGKLYSMPLSTS